MKRTMGVLVLVCTILLGAQALGIAKAANSTAPPSKCSVDCTKPCDNACDPSQCPVGCGAGQAAKEKTEARKS